MARKYRQRGYQDDEVEPRPGRPGGARGNRDGPRGRGLGSPSESVFKCARCGQRSVLDVEVGSVCRGCGAALHSCKNCRHFDSAAVNECRAGVDKRIAGKAEANECGLFERRLVRGFADDSEGRVDPKAAFDALFDL